MTDNVGSFAREVKRSGEAQPATPEKPAPEVPVLAALGQAVDMIAGYPAPVAAEPKSTGDGGVVAEDQKPRLHDELSECNGDVDLLLERLCKADRLDDAAYLLAKGGATGERALGLACARGDAALINLLLSGGVNPNLKNGIFFAKVCDKGDFSCADQGALACARVFLAHGADPNTRSGDVSLLNKAAIKSDVDMMMLLLEFGADPNRIDKDGFAPLHSVAVVPPREIKFVHRMIELLVDHGADIDAVTTINGSPVTPLSIACSGGWLRQVDERQVALVERLLHFGADPDLPRDQEYSPFWICLEKGAARCTEIIDLLITHAKLSADRGQELLCIASECDNVNVVGRLLAKGVEVNARPPASSSSGSAEPLPWYWTTTPLILSVKSTDAPASMTRMLLAAGADPHARDEKGRTALEYASSPYALKRDSKESEKLKLVIQAEQGAKKAPANF